MAAIPDPVLDAYRVDRGTGGDPCQHFAAGDATSLSQWGVSNNANVGAAQGALTATVDGSLLIADATATIFKEALPTGSNGIVVAPGAGTLGIANSWTGDVTITAGVTTASDAIKTKFIHSLRELDLAGGAQNNVPLFKPDVACTLVSAYLEFTVAPGSVAATVSIGKPGDATYYLNAHATATGGAIWDKDPLTLLATDIAADQSVFCSTDGAGDAGKVLVWLSFKID
jgi:hypothetical protein